MPIGPCLACKAGAKACPGGGVGGMKGATVGNGIASAWPAPAGVGWCRGGNRYADGWRDSID